MGLHTDSASCRILVDRTEGTLVSRWDTTRLLLSHDGLPLRLSIDKTALVERDTFGAEGPIQVISLSTLRCFVGAYEASCSLARLLSFVEASLPTLFNATFATWGCMLVRHHLLCSLI